MKLILKLCLVAAIWAFGLYQGAIAYSDPAGQAWAELIPRVIALVLSIPICISIARTPLAPTTRRRKLKRVLLCVPLAIAASPVLIVGIVVGWPVLLIGGVVWGVVVFRRKRKTRRPPAPPPASQEKQEEREPPPPPPPPLVPATPMPVRKRLPALPRTRPPKFGIAAWVVLVLLLLPAGFILSYLTQPINAPGFGAIGVVAIILLLAGLVLLVDLIASVACALASLNRREKPPWLAVSCLVFWSIAAVVAFGAVVYFMVRN